MLQGVSPAHHGQVVQAIEALHLGKQIQINICFKCLTNTCFYYCYYYHHHHHYYYYYFYYYY